MSTALQHSEQQPVSITATWRTANAIKAQRDTVVTLMRDVMRDGVDYGTIPGTPKPTLFKPGSEKLLSMFRLATKPVVEDLSTPDTIRYRVTIAISTIEGGVFVGEGIGEASSAESKYQWRKIICQEEWDETPEDRRRRKWKKGRDGVFSEQQVRTDMEDVANTVLKMAKKRAQIDAVLTTTAASDVFSQDLDDLKDLGLDPSEDGAPPSEQPLPNNLQPKQQDNQPAARQQQQPQQQRQAAPAQQVGSKVTQDQSRRFYAIWKNAGKTKEQVKQYLQSTFGIGDDREMLAASYEQACEWARSR